jgi:hypothetical protein
MTDRAGTVPEKSTYLLLLTAAPLVWMLHFLVCYATVSVWCARFSSVGGTLGSVPWWVAGFTAVAIGAIAAIAWGGHQRHSWGAGKPPHDADTPEDRHRFLGFATLLLAGLSAVATIYSAIAVFSIQSC